MSFVATIALVFVLIVRPQEIWPWLESFRLLDVFTGLAALGVIVEIALGKQKPPFTTPQLGILGVFVVNCYLSSVFAVGRDGLDFATKHALLAAVFMLVIVYGTATYSRLIALMSLLAVLAVLVSAVAIDQSQNEPVCIELSNEPDTEVQDGTPDGRTCETAHGCTKDGRTDVDYACEKPGLFGTYSIMRRPRYRGQLGDPNELSVFLGAVIPLALALSAHVKKKLFTAVAIAAIGVWLYTVILTQSRGGQLVVATVLGSYFVSRFGYKGLIGAALLALPVVLLGGREDATAESSTEERIELLYDGVGIFLNHPIFGVGVEQFKEHVRVFMTAHNSYLLAGAELGVPGLVVWSALLWSSIKIPLAALRRSSTPAHLRPLAMGLVVSFAGISVGIFFLSFTYKQLLFLWQGLSGGFYRVAKDADPGYEARLGAKDLLGVLVFDVLLMTLLLGYTRLKGG